VHERQILISK